MSSEPPATPAIATAGILLARSFVSSIVIVADQRVPIRKPYGDGGFAGRKKMMPDASIGGEKSFCFTSGSSAPRSATLVNSPSPASVVSTALGTSGAAASSVVDVGPRTAGRLGAALRERDSGGGRSARVDAARSARQTTRSDQARLSRHLKVAASAPNARFSNLPSL